MATSFLPEPYAHSYPISPLYPQSTAYFCSEFAIDQSFKIYSGGLGFLAGSHMRSAAALGQNLCGIGICWSNGYYNQTRGEGGEMAVQFRRNEYPFLQETRLRFKLSVYGKEIWVGVKFLPTEVFNTVPMFFLTTDIDENEEPDRQITKRLYDNDPYRRVAQYTVLGAGGARLLEELAVDPEVYHLNEAHALPAAFRVLKRTGSLAEVKKRFVFTTHTPEEAGNEKHDLSLLQRASYFGDLDAAAVSDATGIKGEIFNHSLAALRLCCRANAVSKLHGAIATEMWKKAAATAPIIPITNAQNAKFWKDRGLERARLNTDIEFFRQRKLELKAQLFRIVADQTGKFFKPEVLTIVWARRFASYKRADLIARDQARLEQLLEIPDQPVQIIWAGKPYPYDYAAIETFNSLVNLTKNHPSAAVLVGYELELSRQLKFGADVWLNNPVVTREASGTSGMAAAMNGAVNLSTFDGWICEFAKDQHNSFIVRPADSNLSMIDRDRYDALELHRILREKVLPLYYDEPHEWWKVVLNSMNDVVPYFDSGRLADEYYRNLYQG